MQRTWFVKSSFLVATLALIVLVGDSTAQIGSRLFGRRNRDNNNNNNGYVMPATTTTVAQAPVDGQPAQPAQPATVAQPMPMPAQPATVGTATTPTQGQWTTQRRGLFGRRTAQVWEDTPIRQVAYQSPQAVQGAQPVAGAPEVAPMPSPAPAVGIAPTGIQQQQTVTERRGLFGRRTSQRVIDQPSTAVITTPQGTSRQAFYPAGGQVGYIQVLVPVANAEVIVNDARTTQQGTSRLFVTPVLDPQRENLYIVKAKFPGRDGNVVEQTKEIKVPAGQRITVDFSAQQ